MASAEKAKLNSEQRSAFEKAFDFIDSQEKGQDYRMTPNDMMLCILAELYEHGLEIRRIRAKKK